MTVRHPQVVVVVVVVVAVVVVVGVNLPGSLMAVTIDGSLGVVRRIAGQTDDHHDEEAEVVATTDLPATTMATATAANHDGSHDDARTPMPVPTVVSARRRARRLRRPHYPAMRPSIRIGLTRPQMR